MAVDPKYFAELLARAARGESLTAKDRLLLDILLSADEPLRERWERHEVPMEEMWANIKMRIESSGGEAGGPGDAGIIRRRMGWKPWVAVAVLLCMVCMVWLLQLAGKRADAATRKAGVYVDRFPQGKEILFHAGVEHVVNFDTLAVGMPVPVEGGGYLQKMDSDVVLLGASQGTQVRDAAHSLLVGKQCRHFLLRYANGDEIFLEGGSVYNYLPDTKTERRTIAFEGTALFRVTRDPRDPFTVRLPSGVSLRVLGTSFFVKSSDEYGNGRVSVYSGALRLNDGSHLVSLRPHMEASFKNGAVSISATASVDTALLQWAMQNQYFHFVNTDMDSALKRIAKWYGLVLSNPEHLRGWPISGKLERRATVEDVLKAVEKIMNDRIHLLLKGDTIVVSSKSM